MIKSKLLYRYGLDDFFINKLEKVSDFQFLCKVIAVHKKKFKVVDDNGREYSALIKGSTIHNRLVKQINLPKLGDFVVVESNNQDSSCFVKYVLPRKNELKRKMPHDNSEQIIFSNVDYIFITNPVGEQFNLRKVERMVLACIDAAIIPVIVITKADTSENIALLEAEMHKSFPDLIIIVTSFIDNSSIKHIELLLSQHKVGAFIGSSGSGKSTLTNMLIKENIQKTLSTSGDKQKGKHTTTHREMFLLENGGCIIDNPGIKEFGLWLNNEDSIDNTFADIQELSLFCKFKNCTHTVEPGCNIIDALSKGQLDKARYNNYLKLQQEEGAISLVKSLHNKKQEEIKIHKKYKNKEKKNSKILDNQY